VLNQKVVARLLRLIFLRKILARKHATFHIQNRCKLFEKNTGLPKTEQSRRNLKMEKMKKLLFLIVFMLFTTLGFSQKLTYSKDYNGNTVAKDQYGNVVATGSKDYNGNFVWKDKYGNVIKTESKDYNGNTVSKDTYGNTKSTQSTDYNGNEVVKDKYGNTLYTLSKDYNGNIVKKDKYGKVLGTYKKDYNGNMVYHPNNY